MYYFNTIFLRDLNTEVVFALQMRMYEYQTLSS